MVKISKKLLAVMLVTILSAMLPTLAFAEKTDVEAKLKMLGEVNVLDVVKVGGKCDKIYAKVKMVGPLKGVLQKLDDVKIKYDIYHNKKGEPLKGKIAANGEIVAKPGQDYFTVTYDPTANPEGPAGNYALKIKLVVGKKVSKHIVTAKVKIGKECKKGDNPPGNNGPGGNDPGNNNPGGNNPGDNPKPGNKLPKTATNYANGMTTGAAIILLGGLFLLYRRQVS